MTGWEKKILDAFISHYFASVPETDERSVLRLRSSVFFPDFDTALPDEKVSYLEAAEALERKGIVKLNWEKRGKGEHLKTLSCEKFEKLFTETKRSFPNTEAKIIRDMLEAKAETLKEAPVFSTDRTAEANKVIAFLDFFSIHFGPREIGYGIDHKIMEEFVRLLEFLFEPARLEKITTRALSILLYRDSKRLENLLALCKPLLLRAKKIIHVPDLSFLERSYPETMISGKIIIVYKGEKTPMVNTGGHTIGIPLENAEEIESIQLISGKKEKTALTIENKETFYALGSPQKNNTGKELSERKPLSGEKALFSFDCFLYIGGYSNRAAAALVKILAASGFSFYHAGDLDPDGILILQHIQDLTERPVIPLRMDAATFDQYLPWARTLNKPMLHQIVKIREETTMAIPELAGLLQRIEETGMGVEQEIIDYR